MRSTALAALAAVLPCCVLPGSPGVREAGSAPGRLPLLRRGKPRDPFPETRGQSFRPPAGTGLLAHPARGDPAAGEGETGRSGSRESTAEAGSVWPESPPPDRVTGRIFLRPAVEAGLFLPESGRIERTLLYGGSLGYQVLPRLVLEISALQSFFDVDTGGPSDADADLTILTANARYFLLDHPSLRPYGLLGAGYDRMDIDPDEPGSRRQRREGPSASLGLGAEIRVQGMAWVDLEIRFHRAFEDVDENIWAPLVSVVINL